MTPISRLAVVAPRIGKIIKNGRSVFERGENLLQNGILTIIVFKLSQSSEIVSQSSNLRRRKTDFSKRGLALKGLTFCNPLLLLI